MKKNFRTLTDRHRHLPTFVTPGTIAIHANTVPSVFRLPMKAGEVNCQYLQSGIQLPRAGSGWLQRAAIKKSGQETE